MYPVTLEVSPLLATVAGKDRDRQADRLLDARSRQVFELLKENTRLKEAIEEPMFSTSPGDDRRPESG